MNPSRTLQLSLLLLVSCSDAHAGSGSTARNAPVAAAAIVDEPLAESRRELLDVAFQAASALPIQPHVKTRSRAQGEVVEACFELAQPKRALGYAEKIENWRRGVAYAEYALYCAEHGDPSAAGKYVEVANEVHDKSVKENIQEWQADTIREAVAKAQARLEGGATAEAAREEPIAPGAVDESIEELEHAAATGNFDATRAALQACARLVGRCYPEKDRRSKLEASIQASWSKMPVLIQVEVMNEITGYALDNSDPGHALESIDESRARMEASTWMPQDKIPMLARLALLRHRAGDTGKARGEADAARALFEAERERIPSAERADALRPLAEAYHSMGETPEALRLYAMAVEEGAVNINARPRAEDLVATCCSMALRSIEPDAKLKARIQEIRGGLGDPW